MKNEFKLHNDGINVYIIFLVKSHYVGKTILIFLIVALLGFLVYFPSQLSKEEVADYIFPFLVFSIFVLVFPIRYLFWNLYGKENVIVNTKSISYNREYGIYKTNFKTLIHERLCVGFESVRFYEGVEYGNLVLENYNKVNDLPDYLHTTSIILDFESIEEIEREISKLYEIHNNENFDFDSVSLN